MICYYMLKDKEQIIYCTLYKYNSVLLHIPVHCKVYLCVNNM